MAASKRVRITQLDGKLPNLALMRLTHWHRAQGDTVVFTRHAHRDVLDGDGYDRVYGSAVFTSSSPAIEKFLSDFPGAIIGGTGTGNSRTVEDVLDVAAYEHYDYGDHDGYRPSLGFTSRGCRSNCSFCGVPAKEGKCRSVNTILGIWRGGDHDRHIHLLDNDFFGQPKTAWLARLREIADGDFQVCFNQGINVRAISPSVAQAIADHLIVRRGKAVSYRYRDDDFARPRLYTAWDNLGDELAFFRGVDALEKVGIPPHHLMVYMLVGYDPDETIAHVMHRFDKMVARGILPYPMVYDPTRRDLKDFQKWAVTGVYRSRNPDGTQAVPFAHFSNSIKTAALVSRRQAAITAAAQFQIL